MGETWQFTRPASLMKSPDEQARGRPESIIMCLIVWSGGSSAATWTQGQGLVSWSNTGGEWRVLGVEWCVELDEIVGGLPG